MDDPKHPTRQTQGESHLWYRAADAFQRDWDLSRRDERSPATAAPRDPGGGDEAGSDEAATRFGYNAARSSAYRGQIAWNSALESRLQMAWEALNSGREWVEACHAVRHGWARARRRGDE